MSQDVQESQSQALTRHWPWKTAIEVDSIEEELGINAWLICEQAAGFGINNLKAEFKGAWGSKEALEIDHDAPEDVLGQTVAIYVGVEPSSVEMELREVSFAKALEQFADAFAEEHHAGYEFNEGGGAELVFDIQARSVDGKLKERREVQGEDIEAGSESESLLEGLSEGELQIEIADPKASYSHRHAFNAVNHRLLLSALKHLGVTNVRCTYSGSGDNGCTENPEFYCGDEADPYSGNNRAPDVAGTLAQFNHRGFPSPVSIEEAVMEMMNNQISRRHSGYEDGDGGNGHVILDVVNAEVSWVGYNAGDWDYETDVTGSVSIHGQEPAHAAVLRP